MLKHVQAMTSIATRLQAVVSGVQTSASMTKFLFSDSSRPILVSIQPHIQGVKVK